eukprot:1973853-Amphidinium_carterae.1
MSPVLGSPKTIKRNCKKRNKNTKVNHHILVPSQPSTLLSVGTLRHMLGPGSGIQESKYLSLLNHNEANNASVPDGWNAGMPPAGLMVIH